MGSEYPAHFGLPRWVLKTSRSKYDSHGRESVRVIITHEWPRLICAALTERSNHVAVRKSREIGMIVPQSANRSAPGAIRYTATQSPPRPRIQVLRCMLLLIMRSPMWKLFALKLFVSLILVSMILGAMAVSLRAQQSTAKPEDTEVWQPEP